MRAPRAGVLHLFEHEHGRALANHEAVTVSGEGPGRALRVVVAARDGAHVGQAGNGQAEQRRLELPASMAAAAPRRIIS